MTERLTWVCSEIGNPKRNLGKRIVYSQNDPKIEDLISLLAQEDVLVAELAELASQAGDDMT